MGIPEQLADEDDPEETMESFGPLLAMKLDIEQNMERKIILHAFACLRRANLYLEYGKPSQHQADQWIAPGNAWTQLATSINKYLD